MRDELHWLPYPHHIVYRISALFRRCIEGLAPPYLREHCCSTTQVQRVEAELCCWPCDLEWASCQSPPKYPLIAPSPSSLPSRPLDLTQTGPGALLSRQS